MYKCKRGRETDRRGGGERANKRGRETEQCYWFTVITSSVAEIFLMRTKKQRGQMLETQEIHSGLETNRNGSLERSQVRQ